MYRIVFLRNSVWALFLLVACTNNKVQEQSTHLPYYNEPNFTPIFISNTQSVNDSITHQIGNFSFTNQHGKTITQEKINNKIHVANFIFTTCGSICPTMTKHMKLVQDAFEKDTNIVQLSYSVTPWIDNVAKLKTYATNNAIKSANWHLLTGNKAAIYTLARTSYFAEEDLGFTKDSTEFLHTEHILLIDKTKRIRGIYNGTLQLEIEQLIKDIHTLIKQEN